MARVDSLDREVHRDVSQLQEAVTALDSRISNLPGSGSWALDKLAASVSGLKEGSEAHQASLARILGQIASLEALLAAQEASFDALRSHRCRPLPPSSNFELGCLGKRLHRGHWAAELRCQPCYAGNATAPKTALTGSTAADPKARRQNHMQQRNPGKWHPALPHSQWLSMPLPRALTAMMMKAGDNLPASAGANRCPSSSCLEACARQGLDRKPRLLLA